MPLASCVLAKHQRAISGVLEKDTCAFEASGEDRRDGSVYGGQFPASLCRKTSKTPINESVCSSLLKRILRYGGHAGRQR